MTKQRLSKVLAAAGVASRRACEEIIFAGRVEVDGQVVTIPQTLCDLAENTILVDGNPVQTEEKIYYILNKPAGYVCTSQPSRNHKRVLELFPKGKRLFTVGRLDKETTGLLLVTNDGQLANRIIHPSSGLTKEYVVRANRDITDIHLKKISAGCDVEGAFVKPTKVKKMRRNTLKVCVQEGRKREVRILVQNAGLEVLALSRVRIGNLKLGNLPLGQYVQVTKAEYETIFN